MAVASADETTLLVYQFGVFFFSSFESLFSCCCLSVVAFSSAWRLPTLLMGGVNFFLCLCTTVGIFFCLRKL